MKDKEDSTTYELLDKEKKMGRVYTDWRDIPDDPNRVGDEDYDPYPMPQREDEDEEGEDFCQACEDGTCSELTAEEEE